MQEAKILIEWATLAEWYRQRAANGYEAASEHAIAGVRRIAEAVLAGDIVADAGAALAIAKVGRDEILWAVIARNHTNNRSPL